MRTIVTGAVCVLAAFGAAFLVARAVQGGGSARVATQARLPVLPPATVPVANDAGLAAQFAPQQVSLRKPRRRPRPQPQHSSPAPASSAVASTPAPVVPATTVSSAPTYTAPVATAPAATIAPTHPSPAPTHHSSGSGSGSGTTIIGG